MRPFVTIACVLAGFALPSWAQSASPAGRCVEKCRAYQRQAGDVVFRCQACLTNPNDAGAWLVNANQVPSGARADPDWDVRWAAVRVEARLAHSTPEKRLGAWVSASTGAERERACLTALHVAGSENMSISNVLAPSKTLDPSAAPACAALTFTLRRALEPVFFALDPLEAREALEHTSMALGLPVARLLLDALSSRPAAVDQLAADALLAWGTRHHHPVGRALLAVAKASDTATMNRLLLVYGPKLTELRSKLGDPSQAIRHEAVEGLAVLAPLTEAELTSALTDVAGPVRLAAALGLANGEDRTLVQAAHARLLGDKPASPALQSAWLSLLADTGTKACGSLALEAWAASQLAPEVRAVGLAAAASCDFPLARTEIEVALGSTRPAVRAAALRALAAGPKSEGLLAQVDSGLRSDAPAVVAAAANAIGKHRLVRYSRPLEGLTGSPDAQVRAEALAALVVVAPGFARVKAASLLSSDQDETVRLGAAQALGQLGGAQARAALEGAESDQSARVKFVAGESLRRLGY